METLKIVCVGLLCVPDLDRSVEFVAVTILARANAGPFFTRRNRVGAIKMILESPSSHPDRTSTRRSGSAARANSRCAPRRCGIVTSGALKFAVAARDTVEQPSHRQSRPRRATRAPRRAKTDRDRPAGTPRQPAVDATSEASSGPPSPRCCARSLGGSGSQAGQGFRLGPQHLRQLGRKRVHESPLVDRQRSGQRSLTWVSANTNAAKSILSLSSGHIHFGRG